MKKLPEGRIEHIILVRKNTRIDLAEYLESDYTAVRSESDFIVIPDEGDALFRFLDFFSYVDDPQNNVSIYGINGEDLFMYAKDVLDMVDRHNYWDDSHSYSDGNIGRLLDFGDNLKDTENDVDGLFDEEEDRSASGNRLDFKDIPPHDNDNKSEAEDVNNAPELEGHVASIIEDTISITGSITATDPENDSLTYTTNNNGLYGSLTLDAATGEYEYTLDNSKVQYLSDGQIMTDTITITVIDEAENTISKEVVITITGTNDGPVINDASSDTSLAITEGGHVTDSPTVSGNIVASDVDTDSVLTYSVSTTDGASYGELSINADGSYSYVLDGSNDAVKSLGSGESLSDSITIIVTDEHGATDTITVNITINGSNSGPEVSSSTSTIAEDAVSVSGSIVATDPEGSTNLAYSLLDADNNGTYGSLTLNADGSYTYALNNDLSVVQSLDETQSLTDTITIVVSDGDGGSTTSTISINITGTNDNPVIDVANSSTAGAITEDATSNVTGSIKASDVDDTSLSYSVSESNGASYGELSINSDGSYSYTLNNALSTVQALALDETLQDVITIIVSDGSGGTATQNITITITGTNDAPVIDDASSDTSLAITEGAHITDSPTVSGNIVASDVDT
ncbi:MAG: VCBS domain-containing protein, partial [Alphaproteobacteria bacterium]